MSYGHQERMYRWKSKDRPAVLPQQSRFLDRVLKHVSIIYSLQTRSTYPCHCGNIKQGSLFRKSALHLQQLLKNITEVGPWIFLWISFIRGGGRCGGGGDASLFVHYCVDLKEPRDDHDLAWSRRKTSSRRMGFTSFPDYADEEDQVEELNNNIREPFINTLSNLTLTWKLADNLPCQKIA